MVFLETLNGLKDELIRLRKFRAQVLEQEQAIGTPDARGAAEGDSVASDAVRSASGKRVAQREPVVSDTLSVTQSRCRSSQDGAVGATDVLVLLEATPPLRLVPCGSSLRSVSITLQCVDAVFHTLTSCLAS